MKLFVVAFVLILAVPLFCRTQEEDLQKLFRHKENVWLNRMRAKGSLSAAQAMTEDDQLLTVTADILANGLKPQDRQYAKIAVIGGGISGMVAAKLLKEAGYSVTVYEASHTVGGRARTYSPEYGDGLYVEFGAMRIPCSHWASLQLITKTLNLKLRPFKTDNPEAYVYFTALGRPYPKRVFDDPTNDVMQYLFNQFDVPSQDRKTSTQLFTDAVAPLVEELTNNGGNWTTIEDKYDRLSLVDFMKYQNISSGAIELFLLFTNEEPYQYIGFMEYFKAFVGEYWTDACLYSYPDDPLFSTLPRNGLWEVEGGMHMVSRSLYKILNHHVKLGAAVLQIDQYDEYVTLLTETAGVQKWEHFDYVISTIPFSVMRNLRVSPPFSLEKQRAIRQSYYINAVKIALFYSHRFWEKPNPNVGPEYNSTGIAPGTGGHSVTDLPICTVYYPTNVNASAADDRALLMLYCWGEEANRWSSIPEHIKIQRAVEYVSMVHGPQAADIVEAGVTIEWTHEPYSGGAFILGMPSQHDLFEVIRRREGSVFFAGEHTSNYHSWIQGAVVSAVHVAMELDEFHLQKTAEG